MTVFVKILTVLTNLPIWLDWTGEGSTTRNFTICTVHQIFRINRLIVLWKTREIPLKEVSRKVRTGGEVLECWGAVYGTGCGWAWRMTRLILYYTRGMLNHIIIGSEPHDLTSNRKPNLSWFFNKSLYTGHCTEHSLPIISRSNIYIIIMLFQITSSAFPFKHFVSFILICVQF